jgi:hypothetical protein
MASSRHSLAFWDGGLHWGDDPKEHRLPNV